MKSLKYILVLLMGISSCYSYGQLNLSSTLSAGQYYNPTSIHAQTGTVAHGSVGTVHLFIDAVPISTGPSYATQNESNILSNEASLGQTMPNTSLAVGKTPYSYGVSSSGAGTYNVPIVIPPGTMGMVPKLSIVYNSQSGAGLLGYGWNLTGLSCISRMGKTPFHNFSSTYPDQTQGVTLTNSDWFALDGNRLITTSGSNGASGTTYATESETFNLVTSNGTVGNGPEWFQVQTKSGLTMEYGHTLDSRLVPVGQSTVYVWYVDKITDQFGNYMTFKYLNNDGENCIQEIDYTGNTHASFPPYNSIVFGYENKTDANTTYVADGTLNSTLVLNNITINSHNTFFKEYSFTYTTNLYTLLQEITETGSDHTSTLNPIQFSYGSDNPTVGSTCGSGGLPDLTYNYCIEADPYELGGIPDGASGFQKAAQFTLLDFNGDGKTDVISLNGTYGGVFNDYDGEGPPPDPSNACDYSDYQFAWNSQVLYTSGIACPYFTSAYTFTSYPYTYTLYPTSISGGVYETQLSNASTGSLSQMAGDFNGDGKDDYAVSSFNFSSVAEGADAEEDIHVKLSTGTSFVASDSVLKAFDMYNNSYELALADAPSNNSTLSTVLYLDLNGDGQMDVFNYHYDYVHYKEYYRIWLNASASSPTLHEFPTTSPNFEVTVNESTPEDFLDFSQAIPMDLNGDGKTELVNVYKRGYTLTGPNQRVIVSFDATQTYGQPGYVAEANGGADIGTPGNGIVITLDTASFQYNTNTYVPNKTDSAEINSCFEDSGISYSSRFPTETYGNDNVYGNVTSINNGSSPYVLFGDFNGDGISDVLTYNSGSWTIHFGRGQGSYASLPVSTLSSDNPFSYPAYFYYAVDVNGDGKTDILEFIPNYSGGNTLIKTYYSTGTSFVAGHSITLPGYDINPQTWEVLFGDFNGDGVNDVLLENSLGDGATNGVPIMLYFYSGTQSRYMVQAVDGYNKSVEYTYQPITNSAIYTRPNASSYRSTSNTSSLLDIQEPIYVVSRMTTVDGTGNSSTTSLSKDGYSSYITYTDTATTTYTYQDAICSKLGLGLLGFLGITSYNSASDYSTTATNTISSPSFNLVPSTYTTTAVSAATTISDGSYTYGSVSLGGLRYFLPETQSIANDDVGGVKSTTTYTYTSDNHGNIQEDKTQISIISNSAVVKTTDVQSTYTTSDTWIPAAVSTSTTTVTYLSNPSYTRAISNSWNGSGHLTSSTTDPSTSEAVTTANTYDANTGAVTQQVVSSADATCPTYTTTCIYDGLSQFKTSSTNSLGQTTYYTYNDMWGKPASLTTPDGLTTTYEYDPFGRSSQITTPDGLVQTLTYAWVTSGELPLGGADPFDITHTSLYSVTSSKSGSPTIETFYDWFDRQTLLATNNISADVYKEQGYDALGHDYESTDMYQKTAISATYGDYDPVTITKDYTDIEHRLTSVTSTCASAPTLSTTYSYTASLGNTTLTTTKPDGSTSSQTTDPAGFLVNSTDYEYSSPSTPYSTVNYSYFSNGHLDDVVLNTNTVNSFTYDAYGRETQMDDINFVGHYTYHYNAYNELVTMQDPNGNTCTMTYDALGRTSGKVSSLEGAYTYTYVASGNGLDLLQSEQVGSQTISYTYDNLRRVTQVDVNGLTTSYTYDAYNNVQTKTYPGGFGITNYYTSDGFLTTTNQTTGGGLIWTSATMNPFGQYVDYTLGNGTHTVKSYRPYGYLKRITGGSYENIAFNYDSTNGNLLSRIENSNLTESFTYDPSLNNRLAEAQAYYPCSSVAGELPADKTADVTMAYDLNGNITSKLDICAPSTYYTNANSNNQPTEVPNSNSYISAGQSVSYSSFNAPTSIMLGTYTLTLTYGPDNKREETQLTDGTNTTTRYYGNAYEKTLYNGTNPVEVNYVRCGGDLVGMYVNQTSGGNMYYVYSDQVGSILTVTDGTNTYNQSFDAWGNYRNPTNGSYTGTPPGSNPSWLYRGFTGHEHLAEMQLINANGRLYDPFINSMLSPDAFVQSPTSTQNYNRYNYCLNNPLKYNDPSGFLYIMTPEMEADQAVWNALQNANAFLTGPQESMPFFPNYAATIGTASADARFQEEAEESGVGISATTDFVDDEGTAPNSDAPPPLTGTSSTTPGQEADILGTDIMTLPAVGTYGVTPSPTTDQGEDYTGYVYGAGLMVVGALMENPNIEQDGEEELNAAESIIGDEGASPVQQAIQSQGNGAYPGVDNWEAGTLNEGDMVGRVGSPNGNYYFDLGNAPDNMSDLYQQLQMKVPNSGFPSSFDIYQVNNTINTAESYIIANPQYAPTYTGYAGYQYYIPNPNLTPIYTIPLH